VDATPQSVPPPELQRLASMVGVWDTKASCRFTPDGPTFEGQSVEIVSWSANHYFLITDQWGLLPEGWRNKLVIIGWNPIKKEYDLTDLSPNGESGKLVMTIEGNVQTILSYRQIADHTVRAELTIEGISPVETRFHCKCTDGERSWLFSEGTSKKRTVSTQ